jgi:hypothetical protein
VVITDAVVSGLHLKDKIMDHWSLGFHTSET